MSASARSVYPPSGGDLLKTAVLSLNDYKVVVEKEMDIFIEAAEQLQALKETLSEQQGSSVRLTAWGDVFP